MVTPTIVALVILSVGAALGAAFHLFRYLASWYQQKGEAMGHVQVALSQLSNSLTHRLSDGHRGSGYRGVGSSGHLAV